MEENNMNNNAENAAPQPAGGEPSGKKEATTSLVLGIVSLVCLAASFITGFTWLISFVTGIVGLVFASKAKKAGFTDSPRKAGFVCSLIGLIGSAIILVIAVVFIVALGVLM